MKSKIIREKVLKFINNYEKGEITKHFSKKRGGVRRKPDLFLKQHSKIPSSTHAK